MPAATAGLPEEFPPVGAGLSEEIAAIWAKSVEGIPEAERSGTFLTFEDQPHLFLYTSRPIEATNPQSLEAELKQGLSDVWALNAEGRLWKITEEGEKVGRGPAGRLFVYDETHLKEVLDGEGNLLGLATGAGDEGWEKGVLGQLSTQSQKSLEGDLAQVLAQVEKKRLAGDVHLVLTAGQTHLYFQDAEGKRFVLDAEGNLQPLPEEAELASEGVFRWGGNHWDWVIRQVVEPTPTPTPTETPPPTNTPEPTATPVPPTKTPVPPTPTPTPEPTPTPNPEEQEKRAKEERLRKLISWYEGVGKVVPADPNVDILNNHSTRWAEPQDNFWTVEDVEPYLEVIAGLKMTPGVRQALENVKPNGQRLFSDEQLNDPNFFVNLVAQIPYFELGNSNTVGAAANKYGVVGFRRDIEAYWSARAVPSEDIHLVVAALLLKEAVEVKYEQAMEGCGLNQERLNVLWAIIRDNSVQADQYLQNISGFQEVCGI